MRKKDIHKEQAIIEHTLDIVMETGIAGIKMSKLAKRVGISPSTLYVYFATKEDLIVSIGTQLLQKINQRDSEVVLSNQPFEAKIKATWYKLLTFFMEHEREVNFIEQWKQSPFFNAASEEAWRLNKQHKVALFEEGRKRGYIKDIDDVMIHAILSGIAQQLVTLVKSKKMVLDTPQLETTFAIVWDALRK